MARDGETGGLETRRTWHQSVGVSAVSTAAVIKKLTPLSRQILVNTTQPTCFSSLIMKIHGAACLHVNSHRYESYTSARISIFLHLDIDSCNVLTLCNPWPTRCALYLYFCTVLSGHLRAAICIMLKHDGEKRPCHGDLFLPPCQ